MALPGTLLRSLDPGESSDPGGATVIESTDSDTH